MKYTVIFLGLICAACGNGPTPADKVFSGGTIYTVTDHAPVVEAVAVTGDKIVFAGSAADVKEYIGENTETIDLKGATMTPGFIESHGHIMGLGYNELNLDLMGTTSYEEIVSKVKEAVAKAQPGEWIVGRGWHQDKWTTKPKKIVKGFQTHEQLSEVSPNNPVYLSHASGHLAFANAKAMQLAGVNPLSLEKLEQDLGEGGEIILDPLGNPTGIFNENAQGIIARKIPDNTEETDAKALELALQACLRNGITSFHDAGASRGSIHLFEKFRTEGKLGVRLYVMVSGRDRALVHEWLRKGPQLDTAGYLTIRSIKLNCDGALGSRGAWLLEPYSDMPGAYGMATLPMDTVLATAREGLKTGFQVNSHAIGDRANREILDRYEIAFGENPEKAKDHRFRIEHAQHLHPNDIPRFTKLHVIAAMQAIHLSSDRPWAIERLGEKRIKEGAYMWQSLIKSGAKVINGTDVPVEPINPIACFYASVTRKTLGGTPAEGYEPAEAMTREQALRSYTIDAAFGEFAEGSKGSIEAGKRADFTILSQDILKVPEDQIQKTEVLMTVVGGKVQYKKG